MEFPGTQDQLQAAGENCFWRPRTSIRWTPQNVVIRQGYQEASNVKLVDELVNMILVSRMYEANMKLVTVKRESSSTAIGVAMG